MQSERINGDSLWHTFVIFRGRKIQFKNFIGFHNGVKLVRSAAGGCLGAVRTGRQVGDVLPGGTVSLTVSCCLRQPRIASGATRWLLGQSGASQPGQPAINLSSLLTAANAVRLSLLSFCDRLSVVRDFHLRWL